MKSGVFAPFLPPALKFDSKGETLPTFGYVWGGTPPGPYRNSPLLDSIKGEINALQITRTWHNFQ